MFPAKQEDFKKEKMVGGDHVMLDFAMQVGPENFTVPLINIRRNTARENQLLIQ